MADDITIKGKKTNKGERMTKGTGWRLAKITGRQRTFVGTLLETINIGNNRIAIFSVPVRNGSGKDDPVFDPLRDDFCPKCKGLGCKHCKDGFIRRSKFKPLNAHFR